MEMRFEPERNHKVDTRERLVNIEYTPKMPSSNSYLLQTPFCSCLCNSYKYVVIVRHRRKEKAGRE